MERSPLNALLESLQESLGQVAAPRRAQMTREFEQLRSLLMHARPPQLMIIGRRGAGKSSLINAICRMRVAATGAVLSETMAPTWYDVATPRGKLRLLDTRGLGDSSTATGGADPIKQLQAPIDAEAPDALLFLMKAKEIDARAAEDVRGVLQIRKYIESRHGVQVPVLVLVTQVDELDPKRVDPPFDHPEKQEHIQTAVGRARELFQEHHVGVLQIIPIAAYAEYEGDQQIHQTYWNIDKVVEYLAEHLPQEAQVILARVAQNRQVQEKKARKIVAGVATMAGGVAATPIPIADIVPITGLQIGMIVSIAYVAGRDLSYASAREFLGALGVNLGAAFVFRQAARGLAKIAFPGVGSAVSAGVAATGTWGIGEAAIAYFIHGANIGDAKKWLHKKRQAPADES